MKARVEIGGTRRAAVNELVSAAKNRIGQVLLQSRTHLQPDSV
jgi:hypothetical protein